MLLSEEIHNYLKKTARIAMVILFAAAFVRFIIIEPGRVNGLSMEPSFKDNDIFIVNKPVYFIHAPERYDVVQAFDPQNADTILIKRIIGLPGETLLLKENSIRILKSDATEEIIHEPYLKGDTITRSHATTGTKITIPDDSYFLLGDNRPVSHDSREFGTVHRKMIIGKIISFH